MKFNNEEVRRQDRLLDEKRAFEILQSGEYGVLSMQDENGTGAYGVPVNYVCPPTCWVEAVQPR